MKIVFTPDWFLGNDVLIEGFSFLVLIAFFIFTIKSYNLSKKKNFLYLGIGFLLVALAQLATILTKMVLYYDTSFTQNIGQAIVTYHIVNSVDIFYYTGFFFYKLLTLAGLYVIYRLPKEKDFSDDFFLVGFFILISVIFSNIVYYVFHLTIIFLLLLIIHKYWKIYNKNKSPNTKILVLSFSMLTFAHILFLFSKIGVVYVFGNLIELVSYIILLLLIIRILNSAKKNS
ncbi:hypothetical protein HYW76_00625 [Candidatus Pacearchaeota archaeon]|nr:hypothetical protein [Candidatus Pacearchaeota archaeon]